MAWALSFVMVLVCGGSTSQPQIPRIRTLDDRTGDLFGAGMAASPAFRAIVTRLEQSDVVVYLRFDPTLSEQLEGQLQFVTAAAGLRYVVVTIGGRAGLSRDRQIVAMAHELRHALEIADTPAIVSSPSLQRAYERIGFRSGTASTSFETTAAIDAGAIVRRDLSGHTRHC